MFNSMFIRLHSVNSSTEIVINSNHIVYVNSEKETGSLIMKSDMYSEWVQEDPGIIQELCKKSGTKLIQIPNIKFVYSFWPGYVQYINVEYIVSWYLRKIENRPDEGIVHTYTMSLSTGDGLEIQSKPEEFWKNIKSQESKIPYFK